MSWPNQFVLQSEDLNPDYYQSQNQPTIRADLEPVMYNEHSYYPPDTNHSAFDYSFLLENQPHPSTSDRTWEEEPTQGDGARSCSSLGSNNSKKSQKISKDDKRKRNTAASARFRIKKKMKEKELQSTASEMTNKAESMKQRVKDLESEVKWLKALVVEKDDHKLAKLVDDMPSPSHAFPLDK